MAEWSRRRKEMSIHCNTMDDADRDIRGIRELVDPVTRRGFESARSNGFNAMGNRRF